MSRVAVLGAGAWGTAIASVLAARLDVTLWARDAAQADAISRTRRIAGLSPIISPARPRSARSALASRFACRSSIAEPSARSTPSGVSGFSRKLNAPSFVARTASLSPARPLIMTMGNSGSRSRRRPSTPMPSRSPGIMRSTSATSGSSSSACATPLGPSAASRTS